VYFSREYFGQVYFDREYFGRVYFDRECFGWVYFDQEYFDREYLDRMYFVENILAGCTLFYFGQLTKPHQIVRDLLRAFNYITNHASFRDFTCGSFFHSALCRREILDRNRANKLVSCLYIVYCRISVNYINVYSYSQCGKNEKTIREVGQ